MKTESATMDAPETQAGSLVFRTFQPGDEEPFKRLNEAWIGSIFRIEKADSAVLDHPHEVILGPGGDICVVELDGEVIGCCALVVTGEAEFELAKMTVSAAARGRGVGRRLLEYTIAEGRRRGARKLSLGSSSKLPDAVHLYESLGFRHVPPPAPVALARADVYMELEF